MAGGRAGGGSGRVGEWKGEWTAGRELGSERERRWESGSRFPADGMNGGMESRWGAM